MKEEMEDILANFDKGTRLYLEQNKDAIFDALVVSPELPEITMMELHHFYRQRRVIMEALRELDESYIQIKQIKEYLNGQKNN